MYEMTLNYKMTLLNAAVDFEDSATAHYWAKEIVRHLEQENPDFMCDDDWEEERIEDYNKRPLTSKTANWLASKLEEDNNEYETEFDEILALKKRLVELGYDYMIVPKGEDNERL